MESDEYIASRMQQADTLSKLFQNMQTYPLDPKKIVVAAFEGKGRYGCNPRYIVEALHERDSSLKFVWLMHDTNHYFPEWIEKAEDTPENIAYHLSTARVWIDNYRKPLGTLKRPGQLYIQTWHGSLGIKAVGRFRGELLPKIAQIVSEADSKLIDYVITNSAYRTKLLPDLLFYDGPVLQIGMPRNDIIIAQREKYHKIVRERYGMPHDAKLLLFAPTFRGGNQSTQKQVTQGYPNVDFAGLAKCLKTGFGGEWHIMFRLHPQVAAKISEMPLQNKILNIFDASQADDISELLAGCDALLTDYSSCAFDAAYAYIPVFLYADDVEAYRANRGKFMWKPGELPFTTAQTNAQLQRTIETFDFNAYRIRLQAFFRRIGLLEDSHASERAADVVLKFIRGGKKEMESWIQKKGFVVSAKEIEDLRNAGKRCKNRFINV